ncbi:hypothetical protein ETB97_003535 [Aspergillus alliaceus]|uniref:Uncharacterized protein n=1 Tax=Petromyces alliaceus TaxID=209559 RepID=A0A8H6E4A5_PETAA|nr:hypothetical protein ETB97_003535 [Aspergillus burnettii]
MAIWTTIRSRFKTFTERPDAYQRIDDEQTKDLSQKWKSAPMIESTVVNPDLPQSLTNLPTMILFTSAMIFAISLLLRGLMRGYMSFDRPCTERLSAWAPMLEAVEYEWTQYNSDQLSTEFAGSPTSETETNWMNQYHHGFIPYPYDQIARLNKSTERDWWVHDGKLVTLTEWAHQVHCLGLIRQWIYRDQFDYSDFTNTSSVRFHIHKNHCFLILKTMIECQADVTPVLFEKDLSGVGAWKLRDAPRKCRRNQALVEFIEENKICGLECAPEDLE